MRAMSSLFSLFYCGKRIRLALRRCVCAWAVVSVAMRLSVPSCSSFRAGRYYKLTPARRRQTRSATARRQARRAAGRQTRPATGRQTRPATGAEAQRCGARVVAG